MDSYPLLQQKLFEHKEQRQIVSKEQNFPFPFPFGLVKPVMEMKDMNMEGGFIGDSPSVEASEDFGLDSYPLLQQKLFVQREQRQIVSKEQNFPFPFPFGLVKPQLFFILFLKNFILFWTFLRKLEGEKQFIEGEDSEDEDWIAILYCNRNYLNIKNKDK